MWDDGVKSQDMGDAMVGVKECLLVLGNLRESTSGVGDSSTAPILFGHSGEYASAGNRSGSKWWRMAHPSSNGGDDGSGQRVWTKRWRALQHFALDKAAEEKLMERDSLNLGDSERELAFRKRVDDLGKNVDDHGASCLGGPCEPGILADVVGWVVPRPAVALMAVETCARSTSERRRNGASTVLEPLREQAQMAVALEPPLEESRTTQESHMGANAERWEKPLRQEAMLVPGASAGRGVDESGSKWRTWCAM